ncbi:phosphomannomutase, putative [Entamoeba invadens IP1]|uniref:Phosphomannomutase n=1 Tax=Entamoeba invadens IP1 TaxID=370355 RepID=A0A0A1U431_ENTIV|nr:phosphomannomutase, putative [Entamoeba invadens IP1]ELP88930.1 phosphomannomutase, putative [Entamoeba invadens IP1]|eukprot:XP_004255701.1 phosphomannomutase, putative [Entamoeba invadens IP1]
MNYFHKTRRRKYLETRKIKMSFDKTVLVYDMDGTLTKSRNPITQEMKDYLEAVSKKVALCVVSGSDLPKIQEQLGKDVFSYFKYVCSENGLVTYKDSELICRKSLKEHLGQANYNAFVNYALVEIAQLDIPVKTGCFIELRSGNVNICPVGRNCTQAERDAFGIYDSERHIRETLVKKFKDKFPNLGLEYAIGGQISFDCFPTGWDKTFALNHLKDIYTNIVFFGDKTMEGGNDFEIAHSPIVSKYHQVAGPQEVMSLMKSMGL